jgi:hypothetical protein
VQVPRYCLCKAKPWTRRLINCPELSQNQQASPSEVWLFPTGSINLGFLLREKLVVVLITPSLGVPNGSIIYINTAPQSSNFSGAVAGEKEDFFKGSFVCTSFTLFLFCFTLFLLALFYQKYKKN